MDKDRALQRPSLPGRVEQKGGSDGDSGMWGGCGKGRLEGRRKRKRQDRVGAVPLVLQVESQGQLKVKLDCPTLMRPAQGVMDLNINLEGTRGETNYCLHHSPSCSPAKSDFTFTLGTQHHTHWPCTSKTGVQPSPD